MSLGQRTKAALANLLRLNINDDFSSAGWTIVRGTQPVDFQGVGSEVRRQGWERHPVVQSCIRAVVELIAAIPLEVIDQPPSVKDAKILQDHEALRLFCGEDGGLQSEYRLKARWATHFLGYGNAFSLIERKGRRGLPLRLRIIPPERITYAWVDAETEKIVAYDWRDVNGQKREKEPVENIIHFRDLDMTDGLFGYPRGAAALRDILSDSEAGEYVRQVVTNHGTPGVAVLVENASPEELEAGRQRWNEKYVARGGRGGVGFFSGVTDIKPIGFDLNQLEFPDLRRVTREDICTAFNVDPRIVGIASASNDGGLSGVQYAEARFRLIQQTVYPVMRAIEDELNYWLMPEYGEAYVRFSEEYIAAISESVTQTSTRVLAEVAAQVRTVEEAREAIGLDPEMPADHTMPGGMQVGAQAENAQAMAEAQVTALENPKPTAGSNGTSARSALTRALGLDAEGAGHLWRSFDDTARKQEGPYERTALLLFNAESDDVARILLTLAAADAIADDVFVSSALARIATNYAPGAVYHRAWLQRYTRLISQTVKVGGSEIAHQIGLSFTLENPRAQAVIRQRAADLVKSVTETTQMQIREAIYEGRLAKESVSQIAKRIEVETFGEISKSRALTIARTETIGALNAGAFEAASLSRVMRSKQWLTQGDARVRDRHAAIDGERVDIGAAFSNGLRYPHDPLGEAAETINCRCSLKYSDLEAGAAG